MLLVSFIKTLLVVAEIGWLFLTYPQIRTVEFFKFLAILKKFLQQPL